MKKIVFLIDNLSPGGAQRHITNLAILFKKRNYDVEVVVYQDIPFFKPALDDANISVTLINAKSNLFRMLNIRRHLNRSGASAVIAFLEVPGFIACFSKMGHKRWKLITNELSAKESTFANKRNKLFNWFERYSDAKVGNSQNAINMWKKHYPQYNDKYHVIYNPVIIANEYLDHKHVYRSNGKTTITVAASYQELKNPYRLIEAVDLLSDEMKSRLEINWYGRAEITTGYTEVYEKATAMIKERKLGDTIKLHNETDKIYKIMSESDVVGLFSTVEGLPNTICEAMALGKPIIMSKVSDYDVLVDGNGFLCDPFSVESILEALENILIASDDELIKMGKQSHHMADLLFDDEIIVNQWIDVIKAK